MGHHRGHLPEPCERGLLAQQGLGPLPLRDVVTDGHVLIRAALPIEEGDDGRVNPIERTVLRAVAQLALPDAAARDRLPQLANVRFRVVAGVDDAVIAADQLLTGVLRDLAELVVRVTDDAARIRPRDDGRLVERVVRVLELLDRALNPGTGHDHVTVHEERGHPDQSDHQRRVDQPRSVLRPAMCHKTIDPRQDRAEDRRSQHGAGIRRPEIQEDDDRIEHGHLHGGRQHGIDGEDCQRSRSRQHHPGAERGASAGGLSRHVAQELNWSFRQVFR